MGEQGVTPVSLTEAFQQCQDVRAQDTYSWKEVGSLQAHIRLFCPCCFEAGRTCPFDVLKIHVVFQKKKGAEQ